MKNKTKLITAISTTAIALAFIAPATSSVSAAQEIPSSPSTDWSNAENWTPNQIANFLKPDTSQQSALKSSQEELAQLTKYIQVENNQYILVLPKGVTLDQTTLAQIKLSLTAANQDIQQQHLIVDPVTKIGSPQGDIDLRSLAAHQVIHQWFGVTHLFRSNNAINIFISQLNRTASMEWTIAGGDALATAAATAVGLAPGAVMSAFAGGAASAYAGDLSTMANDINTYNLQNRNKKIGVNIMFALTWHKFTFTD